MPESTAAKVTEALTFGEKTAKRVSWESWSLRIVDPRKVEVTNESYGFEKDDHRYVVTVEERNGLFLPAECECPEDQYREDYDCKHKVAVASVGGPIVLGAAMAYVSEEQKEALRADGGMVEVEESAEQETDDNCSCDGDDFPCWPCYRAGRRDLPEGDE